MDMQWSESDIKGIERFIGRYNRMIETYIPANGDDAEIRQATSEASADFEHAMNGFRFNSAIGYVQHR